MTQLRNLARGHALSQGRNYMTMEDIPLLINVVFSTASKERVRIFELLIEHKGRLTTSIITASLNTSNNTAKRTMAEFHALGLVNLGDSKSLRGEPEKEMILKDEFQWFLSKEFNTVRKNTPYYSDDDDNDRPVRGNVNSNSKNDNEKEGVGGVFPYSINEEIEVFNNPLITTQDLEIASIQLGNQNQQYDPKVINSIYRVNTSNLWFCNNCKDKGDKWHMMKHKCKGSLK